MMQVKNIIHAIRRPPWVILLPIILIIQLLLIFRFYTFTFVGIILGVYFWLIGCSLLIIFSICLIFRNKWAIPAVIVLLLFPIITYYLVVVTGPKIYSTTSKILILYVPLLLFFAGNILLVVISQKYKAGYLKFFVNAVHFIFLTLVLIFPSYFIGTYPLRLEVKNAKQQTRVIADKVDSYYRAHQKYPDSLTELGYEKDDVPLINLDITLHYIKYRDHYYFEFADPLDFLGYWHYDLKNHKWTYE